MIDLVHNLDKPCPGCINIEGPIPAFFSFAPSKMGKTIKVGRIKMGPSEPRVKPPSAILFLAHPKTIGSDLFKAYGQWYPKLIRPYTIKSLLNVWSLHYHTSLDLEKKGCISKSQQKLCPPKLTLREKINRSSRLLNTDLLLMSTRRSTIKESFHSYSTKVPPEIGHPKRCQFINSCIGDITQHPKQMMGVPGYHIVHSAIKVDESYNLWSKPCHMRKSTSIAKMIYVSSSHDGGTTMHLQILSLLYEEPNNWEHHQVSISRVKYVPH